MEKTSDPYEDAAFVYTRLIRQDSQEAAGAIELIHDAFGAHAALRAALIITILKIEVQQNHWVPSLGLYTHLLADYPDALPLTQYGMRCCLRSWSVPMVENTEWVPLATSVNLKARWNFFELAVNDGAGTLNLAAQV